MPRAYERIRDSYKSSGKSDKEAARLAAMTFIKRGKGGTKSSRAKSLSHYSAKTIVKNYRKK